MAVTYNLPLTHFWQPAGLVPPRPMLVQVTPDLAVDPAAIAGLQLEDRLLGLPDAITGWWELRIHLYGGGKPLVAYFGSPGQPPATAEARAWYQRLSELRNGAERMANERGGTCP